MSIVLAEGAPSAGTLLGFQFPLCMSETADEKGQNSAD